ncbi:16S rRNA (cytidine(1402)-2'-O)-methyltransferase [Methylophilus sp. VKM B-3414]|uniref:16S rRNA (cytidine(1402)-2'-O)-methyltransferase n=1 Tax=Methylophilus sp. VKM B-3414 TaxID=3076121 RepID=UPI0028C7A1FB|nr:16S rRNA (cytidine(1402)-2'-O)-methyltransferase [Methylophilus sp. VKM B-3414]MDT7850434.1 16S rRNA (cytidine(1402)-2'-O)-methyltransferase [Methylophilus sp. VKM B-3414]
MTESGTLYVVATPIGNLGDITQRAISTLQLVDAIAAEDTRHTVGLLRHLGISKPLLAVHEHNEQQSAQGLIKRLQAGESIALVTDAGTPAVSDPGALVVHAVRQAGLAVVPIPGVSAVITALSAAGIAQPGFYFEGFLPASGSQRRKRLEILKTLPTTLVFYEAPHRIVECVTDLAAVLGGHRQLTLARELTKTFETIHTCGLAEAVAWLQADPNQQRGEFVLLLHADVQKKAVGLDDETLRILQRLLQELPLKQAVALATDITGQKKNELYEAALALKAANTHE